jgi:hypothetical protein
MTRIELTPVNLSKRPICMVVETSRHNKRPRRFDLCEPRTNLMMGTLIITKDPEYYIPRCTRQKPETRHEYNFKKLPVAPGKGTPKKRTLGLA